MGNGDGIGGDRLFGRATTHWRRCRSAPTGAGVQMARPSGLDPLTLISMHVELDRDGRSIPILHRLLSDLTPLFEATTKLILGGDLNADVSFDEKYGTRRHSIAFQRIE